MLLDVIEQRHICISLRIFDPEDLATGWDVKAIIENPDIFEDFFSKYPLRRIECFDDYYLYFLSLKMQNLSTIVPKLLQEDHKVKIAALSKAAESAVQVLGPGSAIKYINGNIEEIFDTDVSKHDIHFVTLDFIAKYNSGIKKETFLYLCKNYGYLLIDRYEAFEDVFEQTPELFQTLFPSGKLDDINPYRLKKVLNIWQHIMLKAKSNLKDTVSMIIPFLFADVITLAESATIENVLQIEGTVRIFHSFLQRIRSPLANKFDPYAKDIEALLSKHITERGQSFKYEIPVEKIVEQWKTTKNWELRLLSITHAFSVVDGRYFCVSRIDIPPEPKSCLMDLVGTNIPTDNYYTMSHQQALSFCASIETGTVLGIIRKQETASEYYSLLSSSVKYISDKLYAENEKLERDIEQLITMVQLVIGNHDSDEKTMHSLCYGTAMFICALSEKILRLFYMNLIKDSLYVPINKATLGDLLSESNDDILNVFGFNHIKGLSFFLMQTPQKNVGYNIRNNLAHWSNISTDLLSPTFVAQLLWLFTDILNTVFWYFLKDSLECG